MDFRQFHAILDNLAGGSDPDAFRREFLLRCARYAGQARVKISDRHLRRVLDPGRPQGGFYRTGPLLAGVIKKQYFEPLLKAKMSRFLRHISTQVPAQLVTLFILRGDRGGKSEDIYSFNETMLLLDSRGRFRGDKPSMNGDFAIPLHSGHDTRKARGGKGLSLIRLAFVNRFILFNNAEVIRRSVQKYFIGTGHNPMLMDRVLNREGLSRSILRIGITETGASCALDRMRPAPYPECVLSLENGLVRESDGTYTIDDEGFHDRSVGRVVEAVYDAHPKLLNDIRRHVLELYHEPGMRPDTTGLEYLSME